MLMPMLIFETPTPKAHDSRVPKNRSNALVTISACVTVMSCPAPSIVSSSEEGMCDWVMEAYL